MKNLQPDYEELLTQFRQACLNESAYFGPQQLALQQQCKSSNTCLAIYQLHTDQYHFLHWLFEGDEQTTQPVHNMHSLASLIHPADTDYVTTCKLNALQYLCKIPTHELTQYKLIYECRLKDQHGNYHRTVHQFMVMEVTPTGQPCLLRLQVDLMPGDVQETPPRGMTLINVHTHKRVLSHAQTRLNRCEIEVLKYLARGNDSSTIARTCFKSIHTINNHRRNILRKTQTQDTGQAILYARIIGVI